MSTAQEVAEIVTSVHVQSVPVMPSNSVQTVTGTSSRTDPIVIPRKVRGIDGTRRP